MYSKSHIIAFQQVYFKANDSHLNIHPISSLAPGRWARYMISENIILKYNFCNQCPHRWLLDITAMEDYDPHSILVQVMAWWCQASEATSHYLNQCLVNSRMPYGMTRGQWVISSWASDATWRHRTGSTLAQVMDCRLSTPSHHLRQGWHHRQGPVTLIWGLGQVKEIPQPSITKIGSKITSLQFN